MRTYIVNQQALDCHPTLEQSDLGRMYIVLQGSLIFVENQEQANDIEEGINAYNEREMKGIK